MQEYSLRPCGLQELSSCDMPRDKKQRCSLDVDNKAFEWTNEYEQ